MKGYYWSREQAPSDCTCEPGGMDDIRHDLGCPLRSGPEESMHARVDEERARRIAIQMTVSRRADERVRMQDPAFRDRRHSEHVRDLVKLLGDVGAADPDAYPYLSVDGLQDALVELAAEVQAYMEAIARDIAR